MSNIQRHRLERNGAYLAEDHDGGWVLHSDHAAELARVEDDLLKMNNLAYEWRVRAERAESYVAGQDVRSDFRNAGEMRAALDHYRDDLTATRAELARVVAECERREKEDADKLTLLRAECEAWREGERLEIIVVRDSGWDRLATVCAATDAAGILKGAE